MFTTTNTTYFRTAVFGGTAPVAGAFLDAASEKIFEDKNKGMMA